MRHVTGALLAGAMMLTFGAFAQQTGDRSSTLNNSANRVLNAPATANEQFEQVPGGPATPKSQWRTGDERGKPQARRGKKSRRKAAKKNPDKRVPPAESTGGER